MNELKVNYKNGIITVDDITDFDVKHIFECGQCFRWNRESDGSYTGAAFGRIINVNQQDNQLVIENSSIEDFNNIWVDYFDLNRNYHEIKRVLSENDTIMMEAVEFGKGIRLLNQDEWETLISFILSQNRSIPIIKQNIEALCKKYGNNIGSYKGKDYYDFPSAEILAAVSPEEIAECRVGYRAPYIVKTAQMVCNNKILYNIKNLSVREAEEYLLSLSGVGPKVAHCIMLFSMKKYDSFPVDVWVQRVMKELYGLKTQKETTLFAKNKFKGYGGFAQQYLFYYAREKGIGKSNS